MSTPRFQRWLWSGLFVALTIGLLAWGRANDVPLSGRAAVTETACDLLLANRTEGRQALVSSMWWPPLPFFLRLPVVAIAPFAELGTASRIVSATMGAAALFAALGALRRWNLGLLAPVLTAALLLIPSFRTACVDGSSATTLVFFSMLAVLGLSNWVQYRSLRALAILGFSKAALIVSAPIGVLCASGVALALLLSEVFRRRPMAEKGAALLIALVPSLYAVAVWALLNWLLLGDGLYAFRSAAPAVLAAIPIGSASIPLPEWQHIGYGGPAVLAAVIAVLRRDGATALAGLLLGALALASAWLTGNGLPLQEAAFAASAACLSVLLMVRSLRPRDAKAIVPRLLSGLAGGLVVAGVIATDVPRPADAAPTSQVRAEIETKVLAASPYAKVFACGYEGLALLGPRPGRVFQHALDFSFEDTMRRYRGHALFVLVPAPRGRAAQESVFQRYPELYELGWRDTLWAGQWPQWRLFELVEPARRPEMN